jgi:uncharacterized protein
VPLVWHNPQPRLNQIDPMQHPNSVRTLNTIASELNVALAQVSATVSLLDDGASVPFIARYRKEATGNLDDTQLRFLEERLTYLRELEARRVQVLESIESQGKLEAPLAVAIERAASKQELEDLYLPYRQKRRTRAQIAREAGLEPLADQLLADRTLDPSQVALGFLAPNAEGDLKVADVETALNGARDILSERFAEDADLIKRMREAMQADGRLVAARSAEAQQDAEKFRDYFDFEEPLGTLPSHRVLALLRGRSLGVLQLRLKVQGEVDDRKVTHPLEQRLAGWLQRVPGKEAGDAWFSQVVRWTWRVKFAPSLESDMLATLRARAETAAIEVFASNLKELLLAAPAGGRSVLGLDPGIRTGCKLAVVDATGKLLETATIYPFQPRLDVNGSIKELRRLIDVHGVELVAIGNGTASRESDQLMRVVIEQLASERRVEKVQVSEAGASVYSASEFAAREFPDLDVSLRGAVSIARRLQDPLAELVKIDPKAIGVGQYQHDVDQRDLLKKLDAVVEDCVNAVGVDVNTASSALLARVSGLNSVLARQIVDYRDANGPFKGRDALLAVPRVGAKTYQQAAGFLRIADGDNPLDRSAVHPEAYPLVERILKQIGKPLAAVMGQGGVLKSLDVKSFADESFGELTVRDVFAELEKPGRDPRGEFRAARFDDAVTSMNDLRPGMMLEGVVTNVTAFGAFVDVGVHQDGLVHISALADRFVDNPHSVVKPGQIVKVRVMEVDLPRKRIALSMKTRDDGHHNAQPTRDVAARGKVPRSVQQETAKQAAPSAMELAFAKLRR